MSDRPLAMHRMPKRNAAPTLDHRSEDQTVRLERAKKVPAHVVQHIRTFFKIGVGPSSSHIMCPVVRTFLLTITSGIPA